MCVIIFVMSDSDISEIRRIAKEVLDIVNEPGWSQEQYNRAKNKADELIPLRDRLNDEL